MDTHIMDEFPLQKAYRFQSQKVVKQEGVWVFQGTDNAPGKKEGRIWCRPTDREAECRGELAKQ